MPCQMAQAEKGSQRGFIHSFNMFHTLEIPLNPPFAKGIQGGATADHAPLLRQIPFYPVRNGRSLMGLTLLFERGGPWYNVERAYNTLLENT
jgi:hypothetical protein